MLLKQKSRDLGTNLRQVLLNVFNDDFVERGGQVGHTQFLGARVGRMISKELLLCLEGILYGFLL